MGSEQPAGWSKRPPSAAAASDLPARLRVEALQRVNAKPLRRRLGRRGVLFQYVEPPSAARTKLADFFNILLGQETRSCFVH